MTQQVLRWAGFIMTIGPGLVIAARLRPSLMGWAFVGLTVGSLIWTVAAWLVADYALIAQNVAITFTNLFGIYRWLVRQAGSKSHRRSADAAENSAGKQPLVSPPESQ